MDLNTKLSVLIHSSCMLSIVAWGKHSNLHELKYHARPLILYMIFLSTNQAVLDTVRRASWGIMGSTQTFPKNIIVNRLINGVNRRKSKRLPAQRWKNQSAICNDVIGQNWSRGPCPTPPEHELQLRSLSLSIAASQLSFTVWSQFAEKFPQRGHCVLMKIFCSSSMII